MAMGSAPDAITVADGGGDLTAPMLKIMSVPVVEIIPIERRYICGVNSCKLFYQRFRQTERAPKCSVLLVHGFGEHVGRFYHVIEELIENGCDVHTIDLRGHGLSGGPRSDGRFEDFLNDIGQLHRVALAASPTLPVFLYGQSMGGMLVLAYALLDKERRIRGVIATAPWLRLAPSVQPKWWKVSLLKLGWPLFQEFLLSSNVDPCSLSSVDGVASAAINDRLVLPFITVRLAFQIIHGASQTLKNAQNLQAPLLLFHGSSDQLTDALASAEFADAARSDDKTIRIFEGAYHEIHNDVDRSQLFFEVNKWLDDRCATQYAAGHDLPPRSFLAEVPSTLDRLCRTLRRRTLRHGFLQLLGGYILGVVIASRRGRSRRIALLWPIRFLYLLISTF